MPEADEFRYKAFISYSSADRAIGEKLQSALESYVVPRPLVGRETEFGPIQRRLSPIFRDRWDLTAASDLGEALKAALRQSDALIVLCSPRGAASTWVNAEIAEFKQLGRGHRIIAVMVEGTPEAHSLDRAPLGAFPPTLLLSADGKPEAPPFAPDVRPLDATPPGDGFEFAKLKVIAALLGITLTELTQRQTEADRRQRTRDRAIAASMSALAVAAVFAGGFAWMRNMAAQQRLGDAIAVATDRVADAAEFRETYGVPQGVIVDMLRKTEESLDSLESASGQSELLRFQRARLAVRLHEAYGLLDPQDANATEWTKRQADFVGVAGRQLDHVRNSLLWRACRAGDGVCEGLRTLLVEPHPDDVVSELIRLQDARSRDHLKAGEYEKAIAALDLAVELSGLPDSFGEVDYQQLATSYGVRAEARYSRLDLTGAIADWEFELSALGKIVVEHTITDEDRAYALRDMYAANMAIADAWANQGKLAQALDRLSEAVENIDTAVELAPDNRDFALDRAVAYGELADRLKENGDEDGARLNIEASVSQMRAISDSAPDRTDISLTLVETLNRLVDFETDNTDYQAARGHADEALARAEQLLGGDPENTDYSLALSQTLYRISILEMRADGTCKGARTKLDRAEGVVRGIRVARPDHEAAANELQHLLALTAGISLDCRDVDDSVIDALDEAIAIKTDLVREHTDSPLQLRDLYLLHRLKARTLRALGRIEAAQAEDRAFEEVAKEALSAVDSGSGSLAGQIRADMSDAVTTYPLQNVER